MIYNNIVERPNQLCKFIKIMVLCVNVERHNIISSFRLCNTCQIYSLRIESYANLHSLKTDGKNLPMVEIESYANLHSLKTLKNPHEGLKSIESYVDCLYRKVLHYIGKVKSKD